MLLISTTGKEIGQINGLSVYDTGEYAFGRPTRITVSVSVGRAGVINIERDAELSGPIHNKGVLVLSGYSARQIRPEPSAGDVGLDLFRTIIFGCGRRFGFIH